ncbi:MAG TPA: cyclopropane-fatty-acyl-phospholipid synthase family protein [Beijerinckiaceae bacterium]|nr:cyclopropane-fatty-acyl-phospholipid synthase family protein [Beijerinckiaceae bacterium]
MSIRSSDEFSEIGPHKGLATRLLREVFSRLVRRGALHLVTAGGEHLKFGDGGSPAVTIRFTDPSAEWALLIDPELRTGELFMDGRLVLERGSIYDFLQLALQGSGGDRTVLALPALIRLRTMLRRLRPTNNLTRARRNVAHHYDLDDRLYSLFLDSDRQYSCAYFEQPDASLEAAQLAKKRHIAAKLLIEPAHSVLDIGCGWGGLAFYLARVTGAASVKGITLSEEQLAVARRRADEHGVAHRVSFDLIDYRDARGTFDRIVSVGMFEHVGRQFYDAYFHTCRDLLADDGVMLLHTIGRMGPPYPTNPWIQRYIFPGGYLPSLSETMAAVEGAGLFVTDVEVLRLHYADTLRAWRERFLARRDEAARLYDERFCRMWEFYLAASEATFRFEDTVVFQVQLAKRNDVVPLTRGYIAERETRLRVREKRVLPTFAEAAE